MTALMPLLFIGHGSPENAVLDTPFTRALADLGRRLPRPRAILAVSAHWLSRGTFLTTAPQPEQVFDFHGFPQALYELRYPARTDPDVAAQILQLGSEIPVLPDANAGFDHGVWTVLTHLYPDADVPVLQLSLDRRLSRRQHFDLARQLRAVRTLGVLVVASGNIVHNLRALDWQDRGGGHDWAKRFDARMKTALEQGNVDTLTAVPDAGDHDARLAIPSEDHYWPLMYVEGMRAPADRLDWIYEGYEYGGIGLRSYLLAGA